MMDSIKTITAVGIKPLNAQSSGDMIAHHWHHPHQGYLNLWVTGEICITLIALALIIAGLLLALQRRRIGAEHAERNENFRHKMEMDEYHDRVALEREERLEADEKLRKSRDFLLSLTEKAKIKKVTATKNGSDASTEKTDTEEKISAELTELLIQKIRGLSL